MNQPTKKPAKPERNHPDDRARIEAGNGITRLYHGAAATRPPISYYTPILIQCTLPHSDPKTPAWIKTNGSQSLILASGIDEKGEFIGLPYGSFPRLVLAYIITRVIQTGERRIELTSHFAAFLREIGYTGNHKGNGIKGTRLRDQLIKLLRASFTFQDKSAGHLAVQDVKIAPKFELWFDVKNPDADSLFGSYIAISEEFHDAILRAPVPLSSEILAALKKSPLALDVYMWASYRLFTMQQAGQEQISLSYGRLQTQFGTGISEENYRKFRQELKLAFGKVAAHWHAPGSDLSQLNYEFAETELVLYRSPLLIGKAKPTAAATEADRILASRSFDMETKKKARLIAGAWSVDFLQSQYFEWVAANSITPKNPRTHFLTFIKAHRKRNGETA